MPLTIPTINQQHAAELDQELFRDFYSLDALVELAGLTCATSWFSLIKPVLDRSHISPSSIRITVLVGPGNNGNDALVMARHLALWGFIVKIIAPRLQYPLDINNNTPSYSDKLLKIAVSCGCHFASLHLLEQEMAILSQNQNQLKNDNHNNSSSTTAITTSTSTTVASSLLLPHFVIDGVFGFSFKAASLQDIRAPFDSIITYLALCSATTNHHVNSSPIDHFQNLFESTLLLPSSKLTLSHQNNIQQNVHQQIFVVSIDIPSGWDVANGDSLHCGVKPVILISLTAPKPMALHYDGIHIVGGRFVPLCVLEKYHLKALNDCYRPGEQFFIVDPNHDTLLPPQ